MKTKMISASLLTTKQCDNKLSTKSIYSYEEEKKRCDMIDTAYHQTHRNEK